jgi:hypothetical protein
MRKILSMLKSDRGMVLVMALILMGLLSALAGAYSMLIRADTVLSGGASRTRKGFYAAEAGLNVGMAEVGDIFKNYGTPSDSDYEEHSVTVGDRTVTYKLDPVPGYDPCTEGEDEGCYTTIPAGEKFAGLKSIPYRYTVHATAENAEGDDEAALGGQFDVHNIPIFQFLAFYANDLEINPGPQMNLHGRIHSNGKLYLSAGTGLTVSDSSTMPYVQVSSASSIYHYRKDGSSTCATGPVTIDKLEDVAPKDGSYDALTLPGCSSSPLAKSTIDSYLGSLQAGIDSIQVPPVSSIARGSGNLFWDHADLRIVLRLDLPRAVVNFSALCPATTTTPAAPDSPSLYPIEVQNADGSRNTTKTDSLWTFMCQQRGAIFYNDVPTNAVNGTPSDTVARVRANYNPAFGGAVDGTTGGAEQSVNGYQNVTPPYDYRIYRRVGYDTDGNGVINTKDWNPDICPQSLNGVAAATKPWWAPAYCPWPNTVQTLWYKDTDYRRGGFYNQRERKWMYLLNVNVRALIEWNARNGDPLFPHGDRTDWGLVFFLSVQGPNSNALPNNYGVRIFDAASLDTQGTTFPAGAADPSGLTVVSDQAIYVEGNYNYFSGQTSAQKQPAAVIGDSLNILSQSWEAPYLSGGNLRGNDRKSVNSFAYRFIQTADAPGGNGGPTAGAFSSATGLGVNAAFIANVDNSIPGGAYNGGLENYPRFHEDWSNGSRTFNYRGSFVSLGVPRHVNGAWVYGGPYYTAPQRPWDYDSDFNTVEKLPPLTPKITYVQQRLYTRFYK